MGHETERFWPLPPWEYVPFLMNQKKGIFLPPSLPYGPMSPSQQFFFLEGIPYRLLEMFPIFLSMYLLWFLFSIVLKCFRCLIVRVGNKVLTFDNTKYFGKLSWHWICFLNQNKLNSIKVAKLEDEFGDKDIGEGVMEVILSCLRGFALGQTNRHLWM